MAIPLAGLGLLKYLPVAGSALGGIGAYKKSGGDLGATALGAGLGALSLGGLGAPIRMAGSKLAGTGLAAKVAPEAYALGQGGKALMSGMGPAGISQAMKAAGKAAPMAQQMGGAQVLSTAIPLALGGGAALALAPGAGQMAADVAGPVRRGAGTVAQTGAGVIGYTPEGKPVYAAAGGAVPSGMGQYGPTDPFGGTLDVLGPAGLGQSLQTRKDVRTMRDAMRVLLPEQKAVLDATKKEDFERQMAAAGIRENIKTRAYMQKMAQEAGLKAGLGALEKAGEGLIKTYQYQ